MRLILWKAKNAEVPCLILLSRSKEFGSRSVKFSGFVRGGELKLISEMGFSL